MNENQTKTLEKLKLGNKQYQDLDHNPSDLSAERREDTAINGQKPYAIVLTCSDSRVPPEHIFAAGIGDLFVVQTAGNVVNDFELGSIEYGAAHLGAEVILVMGHTHCGAVGAALAGHAQGHIEDIVKEIQSGLNGAATEEEAVYNNILNSKKRIMESEIISDLAEQGKAVVVCSKYDIETGNVTFYS